MSLKRKNSVSDTKTKKYTSGHEIKTITPTENLEVYYLNDDQSSWVKIQKIEPPNGLTLEEFEDIWKLKPKEKLKIKLAGKTIDCPRYSQSYLQPYKFSGLDHEANLDLPARVNSLLEFSRELEPDLDQSLINWYEFDGSIGKHSDNVKQLKPDSSIFSYSFGPARRTFILEPRNKGNGKWTSYHVQLEHNTLLIMGGTCQKTHYHSVPKAKVGIFQSKSTERRLNVTFRCFK